MKHQRVEWQIRLDIKSTCGDVEDPPSRIHYRTSGAWDPKNRSAGEILAMDLAEVLRVVSRVLIPSTKSDIIKAFAEELEHGENFM